MKEKKRIMKNLSNIGIQTRKKGRTRRPCRKNRPAMRKG